MGQLAVVNFVSLDGVMQSVLSADEDRDGGFDQGGWVLPYVDEAVERFMSEATAGAGALLLGRRTYEIFAATWPHADMNDPAVAAMNAVPKYVASNSVRDLRWANSILLGADLAEEVSGLKAASESETVVLGSGGLLGTLIEYDLVDEYRLLVFPLILGRGKQLFADGESPRRLTLTATQPTPSGVLINTYRRRAEG
ncbi:dihydrofolate reductase family protein [Streptomyces sp. NBC_00654]|uniref:dihydrofolate reductase family protein n=1 Tax=Streptomyces sp. NBC_00654 TaxID=2975799 RepID=UPI00224EC563|nr:dihydrofolate reductase family protein [Streptomyces sp. NBC_00654]MCX4970913.1 dihydrofolate reductase family protein [Streptomyces sp. NBC_00654]